ncbi:MAG: energy transducer TonB [Bdellovibrionia bacterium]
MKLGKSPRLFSMSLCLSMGFHAIVLVLLILFINYESPVNREIKDNWIEVEAAPAEKRPEIVKNNRRIVQTEKGEKVEIAKTDSQLGAQNQKVDRETVSRSRSSKLGSSKSQAHTLREPEKTLSHLGLKFLPAVKKSPDESNWATPGTRPEDYLPGMQEADRTALNTKEFKFYGYFQRIRDRLDRAWVPVLRERLKAYYHSGRHLASDTDHVTKVMVILNGQGEIIRVVLLGESGTQELDSAAIAAFNKAGPFPNPPKGIVDRDREVKIPWDFVLKT